LAPCRFLENNGYEVTYLPVDEYGMVSVKDVEKAITDKTILITIMHSNNETGTLQPIEEISRISKKHDVLFHTDASQSVGKACEIAKEAFGSSKTEELTQYFYNKLLDIFGDEIKLNGKKGRLSHC
jgi:cysteine sulfinate desulfinase/cysteine desulfurase-like protein